MRTFAFTLILSALLPGLSFADWVLQSPSSVNFLTTKNTHVTEVHNFKIFDGAINSSGAATLNIDLGSVDTHIDIRNKRMLEYLFEVSRFTTARFEADIPTSIFKQVTSGSPVKFELQGTISLHGEKVATRCHVIVRENNDNTVSVTATTPILIDANDFKLVSGINKLQELAGLKSISHTVPVMFDLTFRNNI
jgi:polyisoprenoid-binding protein YceI